MYIYLLAIFSISFLLPSPQKAIGSLLFKIFPISILIALGFRDQVGGDWESYLTLFQTISKDNFFDSLSHSDSAYGAINWISHYYGLEIYAVNLLCASIFTYGLYKYCLKQPNPWIALSVAIPYIVTAVGMGYTRQSAALGIIFLSILYLQKNNQLKFSILVFIAASFHISALFCLTFLLSQRNTFKILKKYVLIIIIAFALAISRFEHINIIYLSGDIESSGATLRNLMNAIPALFFIINRKKWYKRWPESHNIMLLLSLISLFLLPIGFIFSTLSDRLAIYIAPIQISIYSGSSFLFSNPSKCIFMVCIFLFYLSSYVAWLTLSPWAQSYWIPYKSILLS